MLLKQYFGCMVTIITDDNEMFSGIVDDYIFPEDNDNGLESIILRTSKGDLYEFTEEDIEKITIIWRCVVPTK